LQSRLPASPGSMQEAAPAGPSELSTEELILSSGLRFWEVPWQPAGFQEPSHSFQRESALVIHEVSVEVHCLPGPLDGADLLARLHWGVCPKPARRLRRQADVV
jgi:hypothetical protein